MDPAASIHIQHLPYKSREWWPKMKGVGGGLHGETGTLLIKPIKRKCFPFFLDEVDIGRQNKATHVIPFIRKHLPNTLVIEFTSASFNFQCVYINHIEARSQIINSLFYVRHYRSKKVSAYCIYANDVSKKLKDLPIWQPWFLDSTLLCIKLPSSGSLFQGPGMCIWRSLTWKDLLISYGGLGT